MSSKTIAKFSLFVIWLLVSATIFSACEFESKSLARKNPNPIFQPPKVIGKIASRDVIEASGIAVSKCQPNVFWTHNDSGDDAYIFAFNSAGVSLGTWRVKNAINNDWEDIAEYRDPSGKCFIYVGDIGDNQLQRSTHTIYRVAEPQVSDATATTTRRNAIETEPAQGVTYKYQDANQNAETLMVHPTTGYIYVLSKNRKGPSGVYKIMPTFGALDVQTVGRIADLQVPSIPVGLLTGGDISPDGRRVVLCDYLDGYELSLPAGSSNFDDIWKQQPVEIDLGDRDTGEAVGYGNDGNTVFATTEGKNAPIIELIRK